MWLLVIILFFQSNPVLASSPVDLEFLFNSLENFRPAEDKAHCKNIHIHSAEDKNKPSFWEMDDENEVFWQEPSDD